jgi:hypothetical protein
MLDEVCETLDWDRKHAFKVLKGLVSLGRQAKKRGRQPKYGPCVGGVIVAIWMALRIPWQPPSESASAALSALLGEGPWQA